MAKSLVPSASRLKQAVVFCLISLFPVPAMAGTRPEVDLSLSVTMSPNTFSPGGRNAVELTLRNAGPDAAGSIPDRPLTLYVGGDGFYITNSPPPYEVVPPVSGCFIERFVTEPLPDGNIGMAFIYYFDSVPAGQSRICTFDVVFHASTTTSLPGGFYAFPNSNDNELDLSNNRINYVFVANPVQLATKPIPIASRSGLLILIAGLILIASLFRRARAVGGSFRRDLPTGNDK